MVEQPSPLDMIFREIEAAINAGLHYLAVAVSLSIPDICCALTSGPEIFNKTKAPYYRAWFDENLGTVYKNLTAEDCYRLRCGVLHEGKFGRPDARYDHIAFIIPGSSPFRLNDSISANNGGVQESVLIMDPVVFCMDMIKAARAWYERNKDNATVAANADKLVRLRPNGIPPQIVNVPVIA